MKRVLGIVLIVFLVAAMACNKSNEPADINKPFIELLGANPLYWEKGTPYEDPGAKAYDVTATGDTVDITPRLEISGTVDVNTVGKYELRYNVSDESGNRADEKRRTVYVEIFK